MNIIDVIIILIILAGALVGFKRGFTKELVCCVGFILITILSFFLKNPISVFLYENLPFFKFGGIFKGVTALNIVFYEVVAFLIIFALLSIVLKVVLLATSVFEKILNMTIVLGIPSKIAGAVIGALQFFVGVFVVLYVLSLPFFHIEGLEQSKLNHKILSNTPVLSDFMDNTMKVFEEFSLLKVQYENATDANEFNRDALYLLLKYQIFKVDYVDRLI